MTGMRNLPAQLPDDIEFLKALVAEQVALNAQILAEKAAADQHIVRLDAKVLSLQEQLNLALARRYAASSEKLSPDQIRLFDEAEADAAMGGEDDAHDEAIAVPTHTRKRRGRRPLPENLPRVDVIHEIPADQRHCPHDGQVLAEIDQVVSEQLDIIPAQVRVIRHVRKQYACACGQCIQTAPLPGQPIPKSMASPGLLAHIAVCKYQDALPLYRQEQILQRIGVDIPRATLANWMIRAGQLVQPLINLLRDRLLAYDIVQMDETTVQVLKEPGKTVVADGGLVQVGCMAHARRKFSEAVKGQGKNPRQGKAHQGLAWIQKLYRIEKQARTQQLSAQARQLHRQQHAAPVLAKLRETVEAIESLLPWAVKKLPRKPDRQPRGSLTAYL